MKKWILVVDDEPDLRDALKNYLELNYGNDVVVVEAKDGLEATTKLHFQAFSCIITDLNMPRKNGWKFIEEARSSTLNKETPIIAITGKKVDPDDQKLPVTVLFKPFSIEDLISIIDNSCQPGQSGRIAADLINKLCDRAQSCLSELKGLFVDQGQPSTKSAGEKFPGSTHILSVFEQNEQSFQILLSLEMRLVDYLEVHHLSSQKVEIKDFLKSKIVDPTVEELSGKSLILAEFRILPESGFGDLAAAESIQIPIATNKGGLEIGLVKSVSE